MNKMVYSKTSVIVVPVCTLPGTSYHLHKIAGCACTRNAGERFSTPRLQRKLLTSDPGMHYACVMHVPWCMLGSLTCGGGVTFPAHAEPAILCIWEEAHVIVGLTCSVLDSIQSWALIRCPFSYAIFTRGQFWPSGIVIAHVCVFVSVCVYQSLACPHDNASAVQARITKFESQVQNALVKIPIILGLIDLDLQDRILPHFEFVRSITCQWFKLESPNLDKKYILVQLRSLLILGVIDLQLQFKF